nr:hypothetical protein [Candidatus Obscuribacter sp.]
ASVFITSDARALAQGESTDGAVSGEVLGTLSEGGLTVTVHKASGDMCVRCRKYTIEVGQNKDFVDLCNRCAEAMAKPVEALAGKG